ncbi:uncharacterized protein T551_00493 [Pneumocystis jirovecii RU7]|uniref:Uncharacterized protein n=1 Tax=Pneumocystis jirovecii (strain RU7) TaxID=1408657 RepID=A0A0W4ZVK8_PNEJ7|nr:uncharacterized protein T551_00493 [Pneumocystis jirovecii RU7]KTW32403.1 hypothetical protein T551_00493 [Pneumocystis jirovecii RU7]
MKFYIIPITKKRHFLYCCQKSVISNLSLIDRFANKVNNIWGKWGNSETKWKKKLVKIGNQMIDRLPYEEWTLKNVPSHEKMHEIYKMKGIQNKVTVHYPTSFGPEKVIFTISDLVKRKIMFHKRRMIFSIIGAPFTLPVALIPIIPNIPGFYLLFRAYSHWKAFHGAQHLDYLLKNNLFNLSASSSLDKVYGTSLQNTNNHDTLLLNTTRIYTISKIIDNKDFQTHLERAIRQIQKDSSLRISDLSISL